MYGQTRAEMLQKYHFATRQALVNAYFLKTTDMTIVQALILFLLPCRHVYDPHTYWILTGVAVRIAQRIGLHRDGETLGLPPFEVQMRRRLFYQIIPLDGVASSISGTGIAIGHDTWDTRSPLNLDDNQIWPGMTEQPQEQTGATEMMFCLARACIGRHFARVSSSKAKTLEEFDLAISATEAEVEEKYIRYCDIVNPLHFLTIAFTRSAIAAMRIRVRLPQARKRDATDAERREVFELSQKILGTDAAAYGHVGLREHYQWHVKSFWLWGSWDSLIFILTTLRRSDLLSPAEVDAAWFKVKQVYDNHVEFLESKKALYMAVGRLTVNAWQANPLRNSAQEPPFVTTLRSAAARRLELKNIGTQDQVTNVTVPGLTVDTRSPFEDAGVPSGSISNDVTLDMSKELNFDNFDADDWVFWDQLIEEYNAQGGQ